MWIFALQIKKKEFTIKIHIKKDNCQPTEQRNLTNQDRYDEYSELLSEINIL